MLNRKFFISLAMGIVGTAILYTAVDQYLVVGDSWLDDATPAKATVVDTLLVQKTIGADSRRRKKYVESIPVISYEFEGRELVDTVEAWGASVTDNVTSSNEVYNLGDVINIKVNALDPTVYLREGDGDYTNWVGFFIWGGIGGGLLFVTYRRITRKA
ncbi:MAG: hypothetical protein RIB47_07035 [Cyclobacteriaceae bacterium]